MVVILIPTKYRETKWWAECCVNGQVRFIHPYVRFKRSDGRKGTALKDVIVLVFGKNYKPLSSGPAITGRKNYGGVDNRQKTMCIELKHTLETMSNRQTIQPNGLIV